MMMRNSEQRPRDRWLVLIFREKLELGWVDGESPAAFRAGESIFREISRGDLVAFYDRLVDERGEIVGIRICPVREVSGFQARLPPASYLCHTADSSCVDVYFGGEVLNADNTGDQAFGGRLFASSDGQLAISVDFSYLAESERDYLAVENAAVEWARVTVPETG